MFINQVYKALIILSLLCLILAYPYLGDKLLSSNPVQTNFQKNHEWIQNSYWFEGKAEINFYKASISKYGTPRQADEVVHILVTEKHKPDLLVKADNWREEGLVDMLKFNYVRRFQTGIYSYREMMSVFFEQEKLQLAKMTFGSQEWCGQTFKELVNFQGISSYHFNTYWDGQGRDSYDVSFPQDIFLYDALPVQLRMLTLVNGEPFEIPLLPSQISSRVQKPTFSIATVNLINSEEIRVPAGSFLCNIVEVSHSGGTDLFWFESDFPQRMIKWNTFNQDSYELLDSKNLAYWELNKPGGEEYLPGR